MRKANRDQSQIDPLSISIEDVCWLYINKEQCSADFLSLREISGQVVKLSPKRRVICSADDIFVKEIQYDGIRSILKTVAGGTACKEGKINLELARRGVKVPDVIAFGIIKRNGLLKRDLLLTRRVEAAISLHDFIPNVYKFQTFSWKREFIKDFAHFIRSLHDKGIRHSDLHVGNILVRTTGRRLFFLLDLDRVVINDRRLDKRETTRNLALILCTFWALSSLVERFYFLKFYSGVNRSRQEACRAKEIVTVALKISRRVWRSKSVRCLANNSRFVKNKWGKFAIHRMRRSDAESALSVLLPDPDKILEQGTLMKDGRTVKASKILINGEPYFLKRYNCKGNIYRIRNAFRRSRAIRTWFASWGMKVRDIPVPEALICLEERRFRLLERSYILFEYIEASRLCDIWFDLDEFGKRRLLTRLAIIFGKMHLFGGYHGDLKWPNILVSELDEKQHVTLSDLDGSRIHCRIRPSRARRDVNRFLKDLRKAGENSKFTEHCLQVWYKWSQL